MPSPSRSTNRFAWLFLAFALAFFGASPSFADGTGYTCTTKSDGTVSCTQDTPADTGGGSGGGWLTKFTSWLGSAVASVVNAVRDIAKDFVVWLVKAVMDLFLMAVAAIGVPGFLADYSLGSILSHISPALGFFVQQLKIGTALTMIGAGYGFRLLRKLLTLGQW